jgi:YHS domain-containing protein
MMTTDPVCFAIVDDDDDARFISTYNGQKYHFCTNYCKKKFDENPQRYSRIPSDINIGPGGASC